MNPDTLFKIIISAPPKGDEKKREFIYYVYTDCNFPERALERAIKEYQAVEYDDAPFWQEIKIIPLGGKLLKN